MKGREGKRWRHMLREQSGKQLQKSLEMTKRWGETNRTSVSQTLLFPSGSHVETRNHSVESRNQAVPGGS